jgi:hypothetical protein
MNTKAIEMLVAPIHGNLNRVMEVGYRLVAAEKQPSPHHGAHISQDDLELVGTSLLGVRHRGGLYRQSGCIT